MYPYMSSNPDEKGKNISAAQKNNDNSRTAELISSAIKNKYKAADTYKKIADNTADSEQEAVIRSIYNEEIKNIELLKELYTELAGGNFDDTDTEVDIELDFGNMPEIFKGRNRKCGIFQGFINYYKRYARQFFGNISYYNE